jgi:hypothetical protein
MSMSEDVSYFKNLMEKGLDIRMADRKFSK